MSYTILMIFVLSVVKVIILQHIFIKKDVFFTKILVSSSREASFSIWPKSILLIGEGINNPVDSFNIYKSSKAKLDFRIFEGRMKIDK